MSLNSVLSKIRNDDSPFFKAEVLKRYVFQLVGFRTLVEGDKLYKPEQTTLEFDLIDMESSREKKWTTSAQDVFSQMMDLEINEGDFFSVVKTGEVGQGKRFWKIEKVAKEDIQNVLEKKDSE